MAQRDILDTERHPFYKTAQVEMFLARCGSLAVGRIMAILNRAHNEFHNERAGFFGFFEAINDLEVARALFDSARDWLSRCGAEVMRGPVNPSTNYECGLLVEGFEHDPAIMMPYNPPHYPELIEQCGLRKAMDLYAYYVDEESLIVSERVLRAAERLKRSENINLRTIDLGDLGREIEVARSIYNRAWSRNWGFVPASREEFEHMARDLRRIIDPELVYIAEKGQEPIGFFLALPDINRALKGVRDGRLLPLGWLKLLWRSRQIDSFRVITMGVVREYQHLGVAALFYEEAYRRGKARGYRSAEMSWVLENNHMMNRAAELLGGRRYKTYRIYEAPLRSAGG